MLRRSDSPGRRASVAETSLQDHHQERIEPTQPTQHLPGSQARGSRSRVTFSYEKLDEYLVAVEKAEDAGGKFLKLLVRVFVAVLMFGSSVYLLGWLVWKATAFTIGGGR